MRTRFLLRSLILPVAVVVAACASEIPVGTEPIIDPALATYASQLNLDITTFTKTATGLYQKDGPVGFGSIAADSGDTVSIDYTLYRVDGAVCDGSRIRGTTVTYVVGVSQLIPGFTEGLKGMRVGGKRRIVVPPALGYGIVGSPPCIFSNAILIFDLSMYGVRRG